MPSFHSRLQLVLGPMLIGFCLDIFLFGITTVQTYLYYLAFPNDRPILQCLVYGVYTIGTAQTGLAIYDMFILYSERYGYIRPNMPSDQPNWNSGLHFAITIPICGSLVACGVQLFYAHRIRILKGLVLIPSLLVLLAVLQWAGAIMVAVGTYPVQIGRKEPESENAASRKQSMNGSAFIGNVLWGSVSSACDVLIAAYMVFYLWRNTTFVAGQTQARVTKLMRLLIETGSLTAAVSISFVLTMILAPGGFFMIPGLSIGKIYAISLLVILNNRLTIPGGREKEGPSFMLPSELQEQGLVADTLPRFAVTSGESTNM